MSSPNVDNVVIDRVRKIEYHILAYRKLTPAEMRMGVSVYLQQAKQRPNGNSRITILSTIE